MNPETERPNNYPYINAHLTQLCSDASYLAADLLDRDGQINDESITRIMTDTELAAMRDEMRATIELDANNRFGDRSSRLLILSQTSLYTVWSGAYKKGDFYDRLSASGGAASAEGTPSAIVMMYHKDEVQTIIGRQLIPAVKMCLLLTDAAVHSMNGNGTGNEVLVPFSEFTRILPTSAHY